MFEIFDEGRGWNVCSLADSRKGVRDVGMVVPRLVVEEKLDKAHTPFDQATGRSTTSVGVGIKFGIGA